MDQEDVMRWLDGMREKRELSQAQIERAAGLRQSKWTRLMRGQEQLNVNTLFEILDAMGEQPILTVASGQTGAEETGDLSPQQAKFLADLRIALPEMDDAILTLFWDHVRRVLSQRQARERA